MKKIVIIMSLILNILFAQDYIFESKEDRVNIIELYTSQGCSSCPSADKWLSTLKKHPKVFEDFIPMAFHVTYWDFIGWKDVFAKKSFDTRQRYYSNKVWKKNAVYTPQFIINAKEYKKWFSNQSFPNFKEKYGGNLKVNLINNKLKISYFNKDIKNKKVYLNIGILGFNYDININRGENKYKTLEHDFVILSHVQKFTEIKNNNLEFNTTLIDLVRDTHKKALVIWLSNYDSTILQSTGGYI